MRTRDIVACLMLVSALAGCGFKRKPPYARDPELLYYKPSLSSSSEVLAERSSRRKLAPPPKPTPARDLEIVQKPAAAPKESSPVVQKPPEKDTSSAESIRKPVSPYGMAPSSVESARPKPEPPAASASKIVPPEAGKPGKAAIKPPDRLPSVVTPQDKLTIKPPTGDDRPKVEKPVVEKPAKSDGKGAAVTPPHEIIIKAPPVVDHGESRIAAPTEKPAKMATDEPKVMPKSAPSTTAAVTNAPRTVPGNFGRDENYTWLQGIVEKFRSSYSLRFCDPSEEDQHGGKVHLEDDPRLAEFKHGDIIAVTGQIEPENNTSDTWHYPRFRIKSVAKVESK